MNKKSISLETVEIFAEEAVRREAAEENLEIGKALASISEEELKKILRSGKRDRDVRKIFKERIMWSFSVAALLGVAIALPLSMERNSRHKIDNIIFEYYTPSLGLGKGGTEVPDIGSMSSSAIKACLARLKADFESSDTPQETALNGKILALAYIRLHDRDKARAVLETVIDRLHGDDDYRNVVKECTAILEDLQ